MRSFFNRRFPSRCRRGCLSSLVLSNAVKMIHGLTDLFIICKASQLCSLPLVGGTENGEEDTKKATEEELSFIKSSICEQWKKFAVRIH